MADGFIQITPDNVGKRVDNTEFERDGKTIYRQRVSPFAITDNGNEIQLRADANGHVEVALHSPRLPFGSIHTEKLTPIFQSDAVYGVNTGQVLTAISGTGGVTATGGEFVASTGATSLSQAVVLSRKRLRYRAGQGVIGRNTARFTTPVAYSYQLVGFGHAEDGVYFGYGNTGDLTDTRFGILHVNGGVREVRTLTVTTGATVSANCTITLNTSSVTNVALTNASNVQRTVWEIATATYAGWDAFPLGATVVFVRKSAGTASGTYSFAAGTTGAAASFDQTKAGVASTDTFIPQASWNGDVLDGTGSASNPSGALIDPTKGNVYQIGIQYLGYGPITFSIEIAPTNGNNPEFVNVHTIRGANSRTSPTFGNPSFPFTMAAYSAGSTTDLAVRCASFAGFIEGEKVLHGNRFSYFNSSTGVSAAAYLPLFTVMNMRYYGGRTNQAVINLRSVSAALKHTSPCIFYLIKNGTLTGNPSFAQYATNSCSAYDSTATAVTVSTNDQILWSGHLGDTGEIDHRFDESGEELTLQPGEWVTLAAKSVTGTPSYVTGSLNTREDQ